MDMRIALIGLLGGCVASAGAQGLQVQFGAQGLEKLSFGGAVLADVGLHPEDGFHIWHMRSVSRDGKARTDGQYGWGESNAGRSWDAGSKTWTYRFAWGTIRTQYVQRGDALDVIVTEANNADSGVVFDGATIYPVTLHFPQKPVGFIANESRLVDNVSGPGVTVAAYGAAEVLSVVPDASKPLYSGFQTIKDGAYAAIVSGTAPDALGPGAVRRERPVAPGQTDTFTVSLRFAPAGAEPVKLAGDAYKSFAAKWPAKLDWKDRRVIGTVYLASSPQGDKTRAAGYPGNPRRWFTDESLDVRDLPRFQARVLEQAEAIVRNLKRIDAQGMITWDIEGEEYPQDTSYVCSPDQIAQVAPEMESVVLDKRSKYAGMKLDDAYFKTITDAGLRVGVCVRPQRFVLGGDGRARQETVPDAQVGAELVRKMKWAHDRWGVTLFYLDSTVEGDGSTLEAGVIEQAAAAVPDSLVIPEESTPRMYRAAAPFMTFLFHGDLGTSKEIQAMYPRAFGVNMVNDVNPGTLAAHRRELVESVRRGDVLMVHAEFWQENDATVKEMYREAKQR